MTDVELVAESQRVFATYQELLAIPWKPPVDTVDMRRFREFSATARLQINLWRWQHYNFGPVSLCQSVCGIAEELGELVEAKTNDEMIDAIGDVCIYMVGACSKLHLDFEPLWRQRQGRIALSTSPLFSLFPAPVGRLAHACLKHEQKIRGYDDLDKVRAEVGPAIRDLLRILDSLCVTYTEMDAYEAWTTTAERVLRRDWKDNAATGGQS